MKLLAIDGNSIVNRAFYGIRLLTTKEGVYTNALYGFLNILNRLKEETEPDVVSVAFDLSAPTFRHREYEGYKSNRKGMPPELASQLPLLKDLLRLMGCNVLEKEGFEADDILGTLSRICCERGDGCVIATGDRDSFQLIDDCVTVRFTATKMGRPQVTLYDKEKIREEYGVEPPQLIDVKAIQGDASDCIPGVAGIGPKGALELIHRFGSLDSVYEHIEDESIRPAMRKKLAEGRESAYLSRRLGTICREVPLEDQRAFEPGEEDRRGLASLLQKLEFFSMLDKMGLKAEAAPAVTEKAPEERFERGELSPEEMKNAPFADICSISAENGLTLTACFGRKAVLLAGEEARALLEDESIKKRVYFYKDFLTRLAGTGIRPQGVEFDLILAAYLLNPSASAYDLERLSGEYGVPKPTVEGDAPALADAALCSLLCGVLAGKIEEYGMHRLLCGIEIPLSEVLVDMEQRGFLVDTAGIQAFGEMLTARIASLETAIYEYTGEININSPKQLGTALFETLGLPTGKKTKSGYSTGAEVLERIRYAHPVVDMILEYRTLTKLSSTYVEGLLKVAGEDSRIHSSFNQTETRTGRISSSEPNLQNIPVRQELGREMRRFFRAKEGHVLVDADYSQIELRVLAHMAQDKAMIEAFNSGDDIHAITASQIFGVPLSMVTPLMRTRAKAVNFGIVYGIGAFSLSKDIGVTRKEAQQYIDNYLATYSGVDRYMHSIIEQAKRDGYVSTLFGRRRYLPELSASNRNLVAFGERVARNMPIQGTSADIIKIAMVNVFRRLREEGLESRLILQVHDELIVEAPESEAEKAAALLREEMENACRMDVRLTADVHTGETWYDAKE